MISYIMHVGITVSDIERSISFYRDILGLKFEGQLLMEGPETDLLFAQKDCHVRIAYLNGSTHLFASPIELLQFSSTDGHTHPSLFKTSISEVCFATDDIEKEYERLLQKGVEFLSQPQTFDYTSSGFGKSKAVYFKDPDGIILELMQTL